MRKLFSKLVTLVLIVGYMSGAIGLTITFHYCSGYFHSVCLTSDVEKDCCGDDEPTNKCCSNKIVKADVKEHRSLAQKIFEAKTFQVATLPEPYFRTVTRALHHHDRIVTASGDHSPPPLRSIPIYLLNRVLRL